MDHEMNADAVETKDACIPCRLHCRTVRADADLDAVSAVFAKLRSPSVLGGNAAVEEKEAVSYWAAEPREVFEFRSGSDDPFGQLERRLRRYRLVESSADPPTLSEGRFCGGWIGWFGYELGRYIERLPQETTDDLAMPLIRLCFYDRFLAYDHGRQVFWLVALELPDDSETPQNKMATLEQRLHESRDARSLHPQPANVEHVDLSKMRANMTKADYLRAVERIKRYIRDGDIYQVNFSQRFAQPFTGQAIDLFHWQNRYNPSPYAAFMDAGNFQIVSASPEMFLTIRDGWIETKPIKGTRPRADGDLNGAFNRRNLQDLLTSEKEQAELNMIIDLERNDIARICRPGTRRVIQPRTIEAYPTVFHAVATIGGQLRSGTGLADILKAVFPGGSITGAPKIRAMEIIDELEPTARGVYTGSIGFLGLDGTVCLNIAIRTVIIAAHTAFVQAGGGIVADSDPEAEWEETITKARALLAGIEAVQKA
jgi:aminodeoxychorismate synthase component I